MNDQASVNPHYVDHVVAAAASQGVEATEDIVSDNGTKLVAKGAPIDGDMRERLLQHKLRKPLEDCVQVVGALTASDFGPVAAELLDRHPLLAALSVVPRARPAAETLSCLALPAPLLSLVTLYARSQEGRLQHAVGGAMLALALARRLRPGDIEYHRAMAVAGLVHDIGELYIDPALLVRGQRLEPAQWRHIATHPLVGQRVLSQMADVPAEVPEAVLLHHERLDGFGYPRGVAGDDFRLGGQIVAAAEWLMALLERREAVPQRASIASRLVPGEFGATLMAAVLAAGRAAEAHSEAGEPAWPVAELDARVQRLAATLRRLQANRPWIDLRIAEAAEPLAGLLRAGLQRMLRIQASFSSVGLDAQSPDLMLIELPALGDSPARREILAIVHELEWRMRELERQTALRAGLLEAPGREVVDELLRRLKDTSSEAPAA